MPNAELQNTRLTKLAEYLRAHLTTTGDKATLARALGLSPAAVTAHTKGITYNNLVKCLQALGYTNIPDLFTILGYTKTPTRDDQDLALSRRYPNHGLQERGHDILLVDLETEEVKVTFKRVENEQ